MCNERVQSDCSILYMVQYYPPTLNHYEMRLYFIVLLSLKSQTFSSIQYFHLLLMLCVIQSHHFLWYSVWPSIMLPLGNWNEEFSLLPWRSCRSGKPKLCHAKSTIFIVRLSQDCSSTSPNKDTDKLAERTWFVEHCIISSMLFSECIVNVIARGMSKSKFEIRSKFFFFFLFFKTGAKNIYTPMWLRTLLSMREAYGMWYLYFDQLQIAMERNYAHTKLKD